VAGQPAIDARDFAGLVAAKELDKRLDLSLSRVLRAG
jgi:hypothetical protein